MVDGGKPFYVEPLFTRDPAAITETQILTAMLAIKGIYAPYGVQRLNHGIGFNTAAIELLLPTYGERLGLKGKVASHWALNPHPTLDPRDRSRAGSSKSIVSVRRSGMDDYIRARSDVYFTGPDGSLRSNRAFCQTAGLYACDMFIGSTLQIDLDGNSLHRDGWSASPASAARPTWAPMRVAGATRASPGCKAGKEADPDGAPLLRRGRKLVVQIGETFGEGNAPQFVEQLDAFALGREAQARSGAGDDLRRRRHAHRHRGRHRQPAALPRRATSASRRSAASRATPQVGRGRDRRW